MKTVKVDRALLVALCWLAAGTLLRECARVVVSVNRGHYQVCEWRDLP